MTVEALQTFLGWCLVINSGLLVISSVLLILMKSVVTSMHAKMFGLEESEVRGIYFRYLGYYKIAILVFNLAPYLALRMMG
tara:strand:+ start:3196 stop:3438 length:243 start_codon:yes stop_codon:yes gene_type:complete